MAINSIYSIIYSWTIEKRKINQPKNNGIRFFPSLPTLAHKQTKKDNKIT